MRPRPRHRIVLALCGLPSTALIDQLLNNRLAHRGRAGALQANDGLTGSATTLPAGLPHRAA